MFGLKNLLMKKMLKNQLKGMPEAEQERVIAVITKNPETFKKIGEEIKAKMKQGKNQMAATMEVMRDHQAEIQKLMTEK